MGIGKKTYLAAAILALGLAPALARTASAQGEKPFIVAVNAEPDTLDITSTRESLAEYVSLTNVYEPLVSTDTEGNLVPGLASAWDIAPDGLKITFHLRQGIKFQSGDELTADDVAFTYERQKAKTPYVRREIKKINVIDRYTAEMELNYASAGLLRSRAFNVVSKAYYDHVGEDAFVKHPVGTGPYKIADYQPGQYLALERNPDYWGKAPTIRSARYVFVKEDTTRAGMLRAGEADLVMDIPYPMIGDVEKGGFKIIRLRAHPTVGIQFNSANQSVPWAKIAVREAIAHAVDRMAIVKGLMLGIVDFTPGLEPNEVGYDPDLKAETYDPALARKMLADAGYPNGFEMPLYYWTGSFYGLKQTAEAVVLYLQAIGIKAEVQGLDNAQVMQTIRKMKTDPDGKFVGVTALPWANESDPVEMFNIAFSSKSPFSLYNNPAFDDISRKAMAAYDDQQRAPLIREGMRILHQDLPIVPLWNYVAIYAMKPGVDFVPTKRFFPVVQLKDVTVAR